MVGYQRLNFHACLSRDMQSGALSIRRATTADTTLVSTLGYKTWEETWHPHYTREDLVEYLEDAFAEKVIHKELEDDVFWICFSGKKPIGYAKIRVKEQEKLPADCKHIELQRIYVFKEYHRTGAAQLLMQEALNYARKAGYEVIWLGVWGENEKAMRFYRKYGFQVFGSHEFVVGDKIDIDLLVKKQLSEPLAKL